VTKAAILVDPEDGADQFRRNAFDASAKLVRDGIETLAARDGNENIALNGTQRRQACVR
jgi:hypothetical protein